MYVEIVYTHTDPEIGVRGVKERMTSATIFLIAERHETIFP